MNLRHFLRLNDLTSEEALQIIERAITLKNLHKTGKESKKYPGKVLAMIFEKSSTRTRVSFETAMTHFGGASIFLSPQDTQLGRGEPIEDAARVLSSMVDMVMIRTFAHSKLETFAAHSRVPVINGLTDDFHPCQLLADIQTFFEHRGNIQGKSVAWIGDGNNMCQSYIEAAELFDFQLNIACPKAHLPARNLTENNPRVRLCDDITDAVRNTSLVVTDVWASMGQEQEQAQRLKTFTGYQVTTALMDKARSDALFMHCLPAHRGEEISAELMDDPRAVVWDEAENRLHAQKALIEFLFETGFNQ